MPNAEPLQGLRILVVEDEPIVAWDLADTLTSHGCEIVGPAYSLDEAKDLCRAPGLDGAVLDVNLGAEKVFPAADILAESAVPFCFVTGYGLAGLRPADLQRQILQKPIDPDQLVQLIAGWRRA